MLNKIDESCHHEDVYAMLNQLSYLQCPECKTGNLVYLSDRFECERCRSAYPFLGPNSVNLLRNNNLTKIKRSIQEFWGDICQQWYSSFDAGLDQAKLLMNLDYLEDMFRRRQHLATTEMRLPELKNQRVLEIGCGGGGHSALFRKYGANVSAIDITPERVISTAKKLLILDECTETGSGVAFLADAEDLPFAANYFDIVYSNGVLHHSENTEKCIDEIFRVLRPGGKAIVMLYNKNSVYYWTTIFLKGILSGDIFKYPNAEWIGRITEGIPKYGVTKNPITRFYSKKEITRLFCKFNIISLRKNSFRFSDLPKLSLARNILLKICGHKEHPGGIIVYGKPILCESKSELALGSLVGFGWNISAQKE
jgi:ubiquinone/menaquinone biosynthesis C-methylase UbiE